MPNYFKLIISFSLRALLTFLIFTLCGCSYLKNIKADSPLEEVTEHTLEQLIESHTGLDIDLDLSPNSPEKEKNGVALKL